ncbi:MAG: hypothetical protein QG635_392 [Bacteroidota bacterium]|nr:hypothetical protein [Bacteroidota bacterium]
MDIEKIKDAFLFREGGIEDNRSNNPVVTTGSIVWGLLLRSSIIIFLSIVIINYFQIYTYWWLVFFALWFFAAYPAWRQWQKFHSRMEDFTESTLCGSCRHFDKSSQLCRIYDEHVSVDYLPCGGDSWEPASYEGD